MKKNRKIQTAAALLLAFALLCSTVSAWAVQEHTDDPEPVVIEGDVNESVWVGNTRPDETEDVTITGNVHSEEDQIALLVVAEAGEAKASAGDVSGVSDAVPAVEASAEQGAKVSVTTGDITYSGSDPEGTPPAAYVTATDGGEASLTTGDVVSTGEDSSGVLASAAGEGSSAELQTRDVTAPFAPVSTNNHSGTVKVNTGDVSATDTVAVDAIDDGPGSITEIVVQGDVKIAGEGYMTGVEQYSTGEGSRNSVVVSGNVLADEKEQVAVTSGVIGIRGWAEGGNTVTEVAGSVTASGEENTFGAVELAKNGSSAEASIGGDVNTYSFGNEAFGAYLETEGEKSRAGFSAGGNMSVRAKGAATGILMENKESSESSAAVQGEMTVVSEEGSGFGIFVGTEGSSETHAEAQGPVLVQGSDYAGGVIADVIGGRADVAVNNDVHAEASEGGAEGIRAVTEGEDAEAEIAVAGDISAEGKENTSGIITENKAGSIDITVAGSVESTGTGVTVLDDSELETGGETRIEVKGDVTAAEEGVFISLENDPSKLDLIIDGTVSGETAGIVVSDNTISDNLKLTVWEIKPNANNNLVERVDGSDPEASRTADRELEAEIQYIIRLEQPSVGSLRVEGAKEYEGYNVAMEGDTVTLKISVPDGYRIVDAFNGTDTKVQLMKDPNGEYYLVVPKGGGVLLSVKLAKIESGEKKENQSAAKKASVTYYPEGGTISGSSNPVTVSAYVGQTITLLDAPEREGYEFLYWNIQTAEKGTEKWQEPDPEKDHRYAAGSSYKIQGPVITVCAVWKKK